MAQIKTTGVTVVLAVIPAAAGDFNVGPNLDFPKDTIKMCVLLEGSHGIIVGEGKFGGEVGDSGFKVVVGIAVRSGGGGEEG